MSRSPRTIGEAAAHTGRRVLRTIEAARYVGLSPSTLEKQRLVGEGPRFVRLGGRAVGYAIEDLDSWLDARRKQTDVGAPIPR